MFELNLAGRALAATPVLVDGLTVGPVFVPAVREDPDIAGG
jgi:hypothetical protein